MFKLTHAELLNAGLHTALANLMKSPGETKAVYNLLRIKRQVAKAMQNAAEMHEVITGEFVEKDVDNKPIPHPEPTPMRPYKIKDGLEEAFNKKMQEFLEVSVELQSHKVNLADFPAFKPTVVELEALSVILEDIA